ncbi:MAG: exosortase A [Pseudomonadota bacterium]
MSSIPTSFTPVTLGRWSVAAGVLGLAALALGLVFADTVRGLVGTWWGSDTFAHGVAIYPISLYLVWRDRHRLAALVPAPALSALLPLGAFALLWSLGALAQVQLVQEAALVAMLIALVCLVLGWAAARALWFPLAFTLFAVPFGDGLIPALMEFTATFTVNAVKLVGIPIYRDGMHFALPSGDFEVAKACSGIRYLIASTALGTLYAYLTYTSTWRRLAFVAVAIALPVVANGLRAFGIVMIAHFSNMKYAVGVDHLVYGWLFFGVVIFALFWGGAWFRQDEVIEAPAPATPEVDAPTYAWPRASVGATLAVLFAGSAVWLATRAADPGPGPLAAPGLPAAAAGWLGPLDPALDWSPKQPSADHLLRAGYARVDGTARVEVAVAVYDPRGVDGEVVSSVNRVADRHVWRPITVASQHVLTDGVDPVTHEINTRVHTHALEGSYVFWQWYAVGEQSTASPLRTTAQQLVSAIAGRHTPAASVMAATVREAGAETMEAFLQAHGRALARCATTTTALAQCAAPVER